MRYGRRVRVRVRVRAEGEGFEFARGGKDEGKGGVKGLALL